MSWMGTIRQKAKDFKAAVGELFNDEVRQNLENQFALAKQGIILPAEVPYSYDTLGTAAYVVPPIHFDVNSDQGCAIIKRCEEQLADFNKTHPDVKAQTGFSNTEPAVTL
jgi:hypothetical protein